MNENYIKFAQNALEECNKPLFAKIGERDKLILGFVLFLSLINILAGFNFGYQLLVEISDNVYVSSIISLMGLFVIEGISLITFTWGFQAINRKEQIGYFVFIFSIGLLSLNIYMTAEGNKSFIKKLAIKPEKLEIALTDTITKIDNQYKQDFELLNEVNDSINQAINKDYEYKLTMINQDIAQSFDDKGKLKDWRKNHEATKNKSLILEKWEIQKQQNTDNYNFKMNQLKQYTDSIKSVIYTKDKKEIYEVAQTVDNSGKIAYFIGICLVFLIIIVRLIRVLAQIATSNFIKKTSGEIKSITKLHTIEMSILDMFKFENKDLNKEHENNKEQIENELNKWLEEPEVNKKINSNVDFEIVNPKNIIQDTEKKIYSSGNGKGKGHEPEQ